MAFVPGMRSSFFLLLLLSLPRLLLSGLIAFSVSPSAEGREGEGKERGFAAYTGSAEVTPLFSSSMQGCLRLFLLPFSSFSLR